MAEIRLPIVADLNIDGQDIVDLGAQILGPDAADHASRRDYVDSSAVGTGTVGGAALPPMEIVGGSGSDSNNLTGELAANYLRVLNPQYDPAYALGGASEDLTDRRALQYLYIPVAGSLEDLSDTLISAAANGEFLQYNGTNWVNTTIDMSDLSDVGTRGAAGTLLQVNTAGDNHIYVTLASALSSTTSGAGIQDLNNIPALPTGTNHAVLVYDDANDTFGWVSSSATDPTHTYLNGDGAFAQVSFNNLSSVTSDAQNTLPAALSAKGVLSKDGSGNVNVINPLITVQEETLGNRAHDVSHIRFAGQAVEVTTATENGQSIAVVTVSGTGTGPGGGVRSDYSFAAQGNTAFSQSFNDASSGVTTWTYRITAPSGYYFSKTDESAWNTSTDDFSSLSSSVTVPSDTTVDAATYTWETPTYSNYVTSDETVGSAANTTVLTGFDVSLSSTAGFVGDANGSFVLSGVIRPISDALDDNSDEQTSTALTFTPNVYQDFVYAFSTDARTTYTLTDMISTAMDSGSNIFRATTVHNEELESGFTFTIEPDSEGTTEYVSLWVPNSFSRTPLLYAGGFQITPESSDIIAGTGDELDNAPYGSSTAGADGFKVGYIQYVLPFRYRTSIEIRD